MSLNVTWTITVWVAVGAGSAAALHPASTTHLTTSPDPAAISLLPRPPPAVAQVVTTAVLFGLLAWRFGPRLELLAYSCLATVAVPLVVIDVCVLRLPRQLVLPLYPSCVALLGMAAYVEGEQARFVRAVSGMGVLFAAYLLTAVLSHGGLGAGDVRTAGPIGLVLGWQSWSALFTGTLLSLLCFIAMAASIKDTTDPFARQEMPFGPAMFGGTFLAILN